MKMKKAFLLAAALAALVMTGCPDPGGGTSSVKPLFRGGDVSFQVAGNTVTSANVGDTATVVVLSGTTALEQGLHYRWQRSDSADGPFIAIEGAADLAEYLFTADDVNCYIQVAVTRSGFEGEVKSPVLRILPEGSITYTVIFKNGEEILTTLSGLSGGYPISESYWPPEPSAPEGKVFAGWFNEGVRFSLETSTVEGDITLEAGYRNPKATFLADGEIYAEVEADDEGIIVRPADNPQKEGSQFAVWYDQINEQEFDFNTPISADVLLAAVWTQDIHAVVAINGTAKVGQTLTAAVSAGGAAITEGLSYQWRRGGTAGGPYTDIAEATGSAYTLVIADQGSYIQVAVTHASFAGSVSAVTGDPIAASDAVSYVVTFANEDGSTISTSTVIHGGHVTRPAPDPAQTGYRFAGWYETEGYITPFDFDAATITSAVTIYAKWIAVWQVTFNTAGGSAISALSVDHGETVSRPADPVKENGIFINWYADSFLNTEFNFGTGITTDTTIYAKWKDLSPVKNIDFEDRAEFIRTSSEEVSPPALADKQIYDFQRGGNLSENNTWGISTEQNHSSGGGKSFKWGGITDVTQRIKLDKIFTAADVDRTFYISLWVYSPAATGVKLGAYSVSNTTPATAKATNPQDAMAAAKAVPAATWTEVVWEYTHTQEAVNADVTQLAISQTQAALAALYLDDIVIKADANNTWRVTFTGAPVPDETVATGGTVSAPADPVRAGFGFGGWYTTPSYGVVYNFGAAISAGTAIYAKWIPNFTGNITISGTEMVNEMLTATVTVGGELLTSGLSYQWQSCASEDGTYTDILGATGSTYTLTASEQTQFLKVKVSHTDYAGQVTSAEAAGPIAAAGASTHTVTFNVDGGSAISAASVVDGNKVTRPATDPTKSGCRFGGWYTTGAFETEFAFTTTIITTDTTIFAKWITVWQVTFNVDGGSAISAVTVDNGESVSRPQDPTKTDAAFAGWYTGSAFETEFDFDAAITQATTIYAKWIARVVVKKLDFEDRTEVIRTSSADTTSGDNGVTVDTKQVYDFQRGGTGSDVNTWTVSTEQNHTPGGGKSFKWGNITNAVSKVKFDKIFTAADVDRTFYISLWVYSATETDVKLGTFSLSNVKNEKSSATTARDQMAAAVSVPAATWTEVGWEYTHAQADADDWITQLAISQTQTGLALYIDDIVIKATENATWRVTFTGSPVPDATVATGGTVSRPDDPVRANFTFDNWYANADYIGVYNFDTAITASRAMYAKWIPNFAATVAIGGTPKEGQTLTATVSVSGQTVTEGLSYQWLVCDTAEGTYSNIAGATGGTYTPVTADVGKFIKVRVSRTGYAGQQTSAATTAIAAASVPEYTVTFNTRGGSSITAATVVQGGLVTRPADPTKTDCLFEGWYANEALTTAFNFGTDTITSNTTIYAKWYVKTKEIVFDNLNNFKLTASPGTAGALSALEVYEFQRGGVDGPTYGNDSANNAIWTGNDHTTGTGKSFKWSNVTQTSQKVKFDKAFSAADIGRTFKISMWVHSTSAYTVKLGAYNLSGVSDSGYSNAINPISESSAISLIANGWKNLTWEYTHTDADVTQLGIGNFGSNPSSATFYIDDIVIYATEVNETVVKTFDFELDTFAESTDWQRTSWPDPNNGANPVTAELSTEYAHNGSKSVKFFNRNSTSPQPEKKAGVKFYDAFPESADNKLYNVTAWVFNPAATGNWVWLAVYKPGNPDIRAREITRVEPGWNKIELRGYKHTDSQFTQIGIAQPNDVGRLDVIYIDDIVVTRVGE